MRLALAAVLAVLATGCNQQATADLAVCKSDLARAQADLTTAKAAQTAAEQKATGLEQQVAALNTQLTQLQGASAEAAKAAEEKAGAKKTVVHHKAKEAVKEIKVPAADQPASPADAYERANEKADVKMPPPTGKETPAEKAKRLGF